MTTRSLLLVDNGSRRPAATFNLRRLAGALAEKISEPVHAVSLLHANKIDPDRLEGQPALTFESFVRSALERGVREFVVLPLFFGPSRALTDFIPEQAAKLEGRFGRFGLRLADVLCPLPAGEPLLTDILLDNLAETASRQDILPRRVVLVDHGSPLPAVTAVREHLAKSLRQRLGAAIEVSEAVMERREGSEYDFNGPLLEERLGQLAAQDLQRPVLLSMLFLSPGRHAGPGGDIADICRTVEARHPGFQVFPTPLVGEHPGLIAILRNRLNALDASLSPREPPSFARPHYRR